MEQSHDIIISGGGMVGLALALAAAQLGLKAAVIERNAVRASEATPGQFNSRVSALNKTSENLLKNLGAWQHLPQQRIAAYQRMRVWDGLGSGELSFDAQDVAEPWLGHIIENCEIVAALMAEASHHSNIDLLCPECIASWEQTASGVSVVTESGQSLSAKLIIACEGKDSILRQQSQIQSWNWEYGHTAIVCTVHNTLPHKACAQQVFLETGPLAFLPLAEPNSSAIVWSANHTDAEQLLKLSDDEFRQALERAFERRLGKLDNISPRTAFPLMAHQAKSYSDGRLVILGDTAHGIHPLAGLGVNLGFLDVAALASEWQWAINRQTDIASEQVLRRFQRQRQAHNLAVAGLMDGLKRLFNSDLPPAVILRNLGLSQVNRFKLVKRQLILGAMGLAGTPLPALCVKRER
ncbi:UbiH/UbiF/VisC/COQ6 family ubiquinone biosynthesis hydroxylase [Reinekea marinisedimentorum]|uniref:2-octaprenylphenol hydroxylase n=1 Tax=Reinekea marinisedimentorum TaxID=230495 RepID=A0A4R3ICP0_9GAMM|nr:UbiH/UbiF/VisC/COQ6 family ubiquinone biosynthesis hydroxylase [Reinekea marinisedimentorum]TCS43177.1 2-octaprenylphenol hydroxylase [Reinekea marinisedimentorum]